MKITGLRWLMIGLVLLATVIVSSMLGPLGPIVTLVPAGRIGRITMNRKEQRI
jgi:hypothetical protein